MSSDAGKLIKQLEKAVDAQDEAKAANLIERVLALEPSNTYALHCKAVLTIHQGKHEAALAALDHLVAVEPNYSADEEFIFQKGYCLYRLQKLSEAKDLVSKISSVPARHLAAQIAYNMEEYEVAAKIYEGLLADDCARDDQERQELITNLSAAYSTIDAKKAAEAVRKADEKTADMLFNAATAELEARQYDQALSTLARAEQLAVREHPKSSKKSLEDFAALPQVAPKTPERALFEDLSPFWVQRAYLHYAKGEEDLSAAILSTILKHKASSVAVAAVASINWAAIKRHKDFFDTHRKLQQVQHPVTMARLTTKQKLLVKYNTAMLLLNIGNLAACKKLAESLLQDYPSSDLGASLLLAVTVRGDKSKKSTKVEELLKTLSSSSTVNSSAQQQTKFIIAQIRFEQGDVAGCLQELSTIEGLADKAGFVVTAASWLISSGEYDKAVAMVQQGLRVVKDNRGLALWAARTLVLHQAHGAASKVLECFNALPSTKKDDIEVLATAVTALARTDRKKAEELSKKLPPPPSSSSLSTDKLLSTLPTKAVVEAAGYRRVGDADAENQTKKLTKARRSRAMRRPAKNISNKDARPDPERWIPVAMRVSMKDLPERRKKELKRLRASEQADKRKAAEKRKAAAAEATK